MIRLDIEGKPDLRIKGDVGQEAYLEYGSKDNFYGD